MAEAENDCVCRIDADTSGAWRKGEFIVWTDLFVFIEAMLVWLGLMVVVMAAAAGILAAQQIPADDLAARAGRLVGEPVFHHATVISIYVVMLFFFFRVARRVADGAMARFRAVPWQILVIAALTGMALAVLVPLLTYFLTQQHLIELQPTRNELRLIPHSAGEWVMAVAAIGFVAPLTEELYFRGLLLGWLKQRMGALAAVVASAAVFGLVHFNFLDHQGAAGWYVTGVVTAVGVLTAAAALRTGSLWTSFAIHSGYNTVLISLPMLQTLLR